MAGNEYGSGRSSANAGRLSSALRGTAADRSTSVTGARPKLLGTLESATASLSKVRSHKDGVQGELSDITMNWKGRYKPLGKSNPALMPLYAFNNLRKEASDIQMSKMLARVPNPPVSISIDGPQATSSQQEQMAMHSLFGEEITPQHSAVFAFLKTSVAKWRARAAQRKNIVAVEHFATSEMQKRAIVKHKEQATITLPMPIEWAVKEEALAVLADVAKVYRKEFGNNHKLTVDAKRRIDRLQADLSKP